MRKFIIIIGLLLITTSVDGAGKGWNVLYDENTGEVVEISYGNSGYQHRIDQGYEHVKVPSSAIKSRKLDAEDYIYNKENIFSLKKTFRKRSQAEIDARIESEKLKKNKRLIVDLTIKKKEAQSLGYTDLEQEYQDQIDVL